MTIDFTTASTTATLDPEPILAGPKRVDVSWAGQRHLLAAGVVAVAFVFGTPLAAVAQQTASFDRATDSLTDGRWAEAEEELEGLIANEGFALGALVNLGRAHLEQENFGQAILAFERALLLDPQNKSALQNLRIARERAGVNAGSKGRVEAMAELLPAQRWFILSLMALGLFVLTVVGVGFLRQGRKTIGALAALSGIATLASIAALFVGTPGADEAVAIDNRVARVSPFATAESRFEIRSGEMLRTLDRHDGFVRIERENGSVGWVPELSVESLVPRDSAS